MTAKLSPEAQAAADAAVALAAAFFAAHPELDPETTSLEYANGKITGYETETATGYYAMSTNSPPIDLSKAPLSGDYNPYVKLFADMAEALNIPLETLNAGRYAANHWRVLQPGANMTKPAEWFDSPNKPPVNVTPETIAAASAPLASSAQSAWFQLATKLKKAHATYTRVGKEAFDGNRFEAAAYAKAMADGIDYAISVQEQIADEMRAAVGSATEAPSAGTIPVP